MLRFTPWPLLAIVVLGGCLPLTCRRDEPRAIYAADSLSRQLAQTVPPDTLTMVWATDAAGTPAATDLGYPRTLAFGPGDMLYVTDAKDAALLAFDPVTGSVGERWAPEALDTPYLTGFRGDSAALFAPTQHRLDLLDLTDGTVTRSLDLPEPATRHVLQYVAIDAAAVYHKIVLADSGSVVVRLDWAGEEVARAPLAGPNWRHAGFLRAWGDTLVSLNGYGTSLRLLRPGLETAFTPDTLALVGFDSPMLARARGFVLGGVKRPPVLSSSAVFLGDRMFVLNMRPGWLQVDVFDRSGQLTAILTESDPGFRKSYFPVDLAVREVVGGAFEIAIAEVEPTPRVALYRWTPTDPAALPVGYEAAD